MVQRISFRVHGRVQGVSYRYFTQKKATSYDLTGWVRNASNGNVEGEAQGVEENIQKLVGDLNRGPTHAHVTKVDHKEIETVDEEGGFKVRT